ncbi:alpha-amylase family glycosyl hydrolase [Isoptericola sp. b490]|uniref:alpha-amylase family glycosyl hydrolase n=1 Tax=Actinotalea lenta TaxID=3064654 RepID=UPI002714488F|nr:alpha-amylase family glycosyl hydrolase [Isoptericola sp. b490]MDO8121603.1 alpha-amylase family glycosyl hydrolase [Isoptericola sp. b490]
MSDELRTPDWVADAVFYQIFPERFANGDPSLDPPDVEPWGGEPTRDNFFGGDFAGIVAHLDHLTTLGVNAVYLTPIFEAETNHRYDAVDYFTVDHRLGDLDAFRRFLAAAHERGIRVVLDAVLNHCGIGHWAFRDVMAHETASRYAHWFTVTGFPVVSDPEPSYATCSGCWYLPKWHVDDPEVTRHHLDVARSWIAEGIDGWRLDVPYFVPTSFWRRFREVVKGLDEDLYIVAEEWREPDQWLTGDTADGTMNYTLRDLVLAFTADRTVDATGLADGLNTLWDRLPPPARPAMLNLLGCHDTERVLTRHGGDTDVTVLAFALLFASHGAPMLYYGDEVGMTGENDPGCRGTMEWDRERWATDVYDAVVGLSGARRDCAALRRGDQRVVALGPDLVAVVRTYEGEVAVVLVNRGGETTVDLADVGVSATGWDVRFGWGIEDGLAAPGNVRLGPGGVAVVVATDERAGGRGR